MHKILFGIVLLAFLHMGYLSTTIDDNEYPKGKTKIDSVREICSEYPNGTIAESRGLIFRKIVELDCEEFNSVDLIQTGRNQMVVTPLTSTPEVPE